MSECLRWAAPVPLGETQPFTFGLESFDNAFAIGLPHRLMEDDVYQNMFIPKGSLVGLHPCLQFLSLISVRKIFGEYMVKATSRFYGYALLSSSVGLSSEMLNFIPTRMYFILIVIMNKVDQDAERRRDPRNYVFGFGRR